MTLEQPKEISLEQPNLLRLDLQTFAEPNPEPAPEPEPTPEEPKFTQADLDRAIGERLAREKAKSDKAIEDAQAEAERKRLEEESEFRTLYEAEKVAREQVEAQVKANELTAKKQALLIEAGYSADKLTDVLGFITGDDEDAITASVERFKAVAPPSPTYVDPGAGNGARKTPEQKEITDYGRELYDRVFKTNK